MKSAKRIKIAVAGVLLQVALGAIYAWSVFKAPLAQTFHWSVSQVTLTFTIAIFTLGISAFLGGLWLKRSTPRRVAMTGAILYGIGLFLSSFSNLGIGWLYLCFGLIGGGGLGLAYIVPISVIVRWFPDRMGLMSGVAVGGFGVGALIMAPVATKLIANVGVLSTFAIVGVILLIVATASAYFMENPPASSLSNTGTQIMQAAPGDNDFTLAGAVTTWQFWVLWLLLFLNSSAGIAIISQEVPVFQELGKASVALAASMVGIVSIGNALGRSAWAYVSDHIGRKLTFLVIFLIQAILFWFLPSFSTATMITVLIFIILMCYGGGFGTMPSFVADYFGRTNVGAIYGLMLTAWGCASAFGPLLIAHLREVSGTYNGGLRILALIMGASILLPLVLKAPVRSKTSTIKV